MLLNENKNYFITTFWPFMILIPFLGSDRRVTVYQSLRFTRIEIPKSVTGDSVTRVRKFRYDFLWKDTTKWSTVRPLYNIKVSREAVSRRMSSRLPAIAIQSYHFTNCESSAMSNDQTWGRLRSLNFLIRNRHRRSQ